MEAFCENNHRFCFIQSCLKIHGKLYKGHCSSSSYTCNRVLSFVQSNNRDLINTEYLHTHARKRYIQINNIVVIILLRIYSFCNVTYLIRTCLSLLSSSCVLLLHLLGFNLIIIVSERSSLNSRVSHPEDSLTLTLHCKYLFTSIVVIVLICKSLSSSLTTSLHHIIII